MEKLKWSFSGLKDFVNCPKQYHQVKVLKQYVKAPTQQMLYGTEVHRVLEEYAKGIAPLAKNYARFQPVVDALLLIPGTRYFEYKMGLTYDHTPCSFDDSEYWVRGIADLLIIDGDTAYVIDYKTGSNRYPDPKQLKLMALMVFAQYPDVQLVKGGLLFVTHNSFVDEEYKRENLKTLWGAFEKDLLRLDAAIKNDQWPMNPTPLCGWCPVTTCDHNKSWRRK